MIGLSCLTILLIACNAEKRFQKQKKKATDFFLLNRPELAELCDKEFPDIPVKVVPGDTLKKTDTIYIPGPKLVCPDNVTALECPPTKIIKYSIVIHDSVFYKDTDSEYILNSKIQILTSEKEDLKQKFEAVKDDLRDSNNKKTKWFWMLIGLAVANAIYFGMKIYYKFAKP